MNNEASDSVNQRMSPLAKIFSAWSFVAILISLASCFMGRSFFLSPARADAFHFGACIVGLGLCWTILWANDPTSKWKHARVNGRVSRYVLMPLFIIGVLAYIPLCHTFPWLMNKLIGEPYQASLTVSKKERSSKGHYCNEVIAKELPGDMFSNICVSQTAFNDLQVGDSIVVVGTSSWLGVDVSKYSYFANQQPAKVIGELDFYSQ